MAFLRSSAQEHLFLEFRDTPLKKVIGQLEKDLDLRFSYAEDLIKDKKIELFADGLSLNILLGTLEAQTGLRFEKIDGQPQIIVVPLPTAKDLFQVYLLDKDTRMPISENQVVIDSNLILATDKSGFIQFKDTGKPTYRLEANGYRTIFFIKKRTGSPHFTLPQHIKNSKR